MDATGFRASTTLMKVQVLFANWAPSCRALVDNVSEWFTLIFVAYRPGNTLGTVELYSGSLGCWFYSGVGAAQDMNKFHAFAWTCEAWL